MFKRLNIGCWIMIFQQFTGKLRRIHVDAATNASQESTPSSTTRLRSSHPSASPPLPLICWPPV
jgi:hypothetical protein